MQYFRRVVKRKLCTSIKRVRKSYFGFRVAKRTCIWNWKCSYTSFIVLTYSDNGPYNKAVPKYFLCLKTAIKAIKYTLCKHCDIYVKYYILSIVMRNLIMIGRYNIGHISAIFVTQNLTRLIVNGYIQCLYIILTKFIVVASVFSFLMKKIWY